MSMKKLYESKRKMAQINKDAGKKKIKLKPKYKKKKSFDDKYKRVTTYLERPLIKKIHLLKNSNKIRTFTDFFNSALSEYIKNHGM